MGNILETAYSDFNQAAEDPVFEDPNLDVSADELFEPRSIDFSWIRAKTGPGSIEDYITHPLNSSGSRGMAQTLRGATGLFGALDLAVIDIALGLVEVVREKKGQGGAAHEAAADNRP